MTINLHHMILFTSAVVLLSSAASAQSIDDVGDLPGGTVDAAAYAVSGDGSTVVGRSISGSGYEAFRWTIGTGIVGIGDLPGGFFESNAEDVNADGSVIVGIGYSTQLEAFRWVNGVGMVGLGSLPGSTNISEAFGVNSAGNIVVGRGVNAVGDYEAFRWVDGVGMVGLGELAGGGFYSSAYATNAAGNIVVGSSTSASGMEAFRWVDGVGMVGLGDLAGGGFDSIAFDVNSAGNVVVGQSTSASGFEAFRWVDGVGMVGLGDLAGGLFESKANAVNASGSVVVGYGDGGGGQDAFYWQDGVGMQMLSDVLTNAGVNLAGWTIFDASGADNSGNVVTGVALLGGNVTAYIANVAAGGVTTPADLSDGLRAATIPSQQALSILDNGMSQSLFAATTSIITTDSNLIDINNPHIIAPAAGDDTERSWSAFAVGSFGLGQDNDLDNRQHNGITGLAVHIDDTLSLGAGVMASGGTTEMLYDGESSLNALGATLLAAYKHPGGFRFYGTAFAADLQLDTERRYVNGAGTDGSRGETDGLGYGAAIRAGWEVPASVTLAFMPYLELDATRVQMNGYTESDGAFPARFDDQTSSQVTTRAGLQVMHQTTDSLKFGGRVAWAHRVSESGEIGVNSTGFTGQIASEKGDANWLEGTLTTGWTMDASTSFNAELTGRTHRTRDPVAALTLGVRIGF